MPKPKIVLLDQDTMVFKDKEFEQIYLKKKAEVDRVVAEVEALDPSNLSDLERIEPLREKVRGLLHDFIEFLIDGFIEDLIDAEELIDYVDGVA